MVSQSECIMVVILIHNWVLCRHFFLKRHSASENGSVALYLRKDRPHRQEYAHTQRDISLAWNAPTISLLHSAPVLASLAIVTRDDVGKVGKEPAVD